MKQLAKQLLFEYERFMWHVGAFIGELDKPLTVFKYVTYAGVLLKVYGINISLNELVLISLASLFLAWLGGNILRLTGVIAWVTRLNNEQNPELMNIHKKVNQTS